MEYSNLYDLIKYLEYGTKLHIGILFFGSYGNEKLVVPREHTIHPSPICKEFKKLPNGMNRCYRCKMAAVKKAIRTKKVFGGFCINGVYEYTRPITIDSQVVGIIFIGNILSEKSKTEHPSSFADKEFLFDTMEKDFDFEKCNAVGTVIESYIKMILTVYPSDNSNRDFDPLIENMKKYINANIEDKTDISLLAKAFNYNAKYLGRLFKQKTGMSINEYANKKRIEYSKELLSDSADTIINISIKAGYKNVTYFNREFKKYCGVTPSEYRRTLFL